MKKIMLLLMAFTVFFAVSAPSIVEAKPSGGFKSSRGGFKQPTTPSRNDGSVAKQPGTTNNTPSNSATNPATRGGFFGGGSFMKGMLVGGLAGMLFGGMFGGMGALGNILGLLINVFAIVMVFMLIRNLIAYFMSRRKRPDDNRRY